MARKLIKLTVMYNLPPGADHEAFMRWRTTDHQAANMAIPGLIKSDFYVIKEGWPDQSPPYRYLTEATFPDMETFRRAFFESGFQARLKESLQRIADPVFLISEEVMSETVADQAG